MQAGWVSATGGHDEHVVAGQPPVAQRLQVGVKCQGERRGTSENTPQGTG